MSEALLGSELDAMVNRYLRELAGALRRLPSSQSDHLISEIREHIVEMRAERPVRDRSDMEALLNRVGLPEDIAAVALEGLDEPEAPDVAVPVLVPTEPLYLGGRVSKQTFMVGSAAAGVLLIGLFVVIFFGFSHDGRGPFNIVERGSSAQPVFIRPPVSVFGVTVPNVIGETESQAAAVLSASGFSFNVAMAPSTSVPGGVVINQNPPAGAYAPRRVGVNLVVSSGPAGTTS